LLIVAAAKTREGNEENCFYCIVLYLYFLQMYSTHHLPPNETEEEEACDSDRIVDDDVKTRHVPTKKHRAA